MVYKQHITQQGRFEDSPKLRQNAADGVCMPQLRPCITLASIARQRGGLFESESVMYIIQDWSDTSANFPWIVSTDYDEALLNRGICRCGTKEDAQMIVDALNNTNVAARMSGVGPNGPSLQPTASAPDCLVGGCRYDSRQQDNLVRSPLHYQVIFSIFSVAL